MKEKQLMTFLIFPWNTMIEALEKIDSNAKGIVFVVDEQRKLVGTLTDGDVRRWLIKTGKLQGKVEPIMNRTPKAIYQKETINAKAFMEKYDITALPVISAKGIVLDIILKKEVEEIDEQKRNILNQVSVVIMAGGKGTRLYPYTKVLPKPLIPIGDIPIMERIINKFQEYGVHNFYATVNYKKNMIKSYFSENEVNSQIHFVEEDTPLGTAGSLGLIQDKFDEPFILTNCDILIHANYGDIHRCHKEAGNELTIVSALKNIIIPYGVVHSSKNGAICSMEEKPRLSYFINTGMYILNPELIQEIPQGTFFHMTDLASKLLKENRKVGMYPISEDSFLDMGEFEEMRRMEEKLNLKSE